jgi:lipopolysaccharide export system permease protein
MKLLDRYILRNILTPLVYCLLAFLMLFVIFDLFSNLSDFLEADTPFNRILTYYLFLLPAVVVYIVPVSLLLAILYGLSQLTRSNELTAMRACGLSLYRLILPIIATGLTATALVAVINESLAPQAAYWTDQFNRAEEHDGDISFYVTENLPYRNFAEQRVWMIGSFNRQTYDMQRIEVIQQREDGTDAARIIATSAQWLDGTWWFTETTIQELDARGYPLGAPASYARRAMTELNEVPDDFINVTKDPTFLSSADLIRFIRAHQHVSEDALARYYVDLHYRLAMPWTCLIVTLLGLPIGAHTGRKGAMRGITATLALFFSFYVLINIGMALGKNQTLPASIAVWSPNLLYLAISLVLIRRMR